MVLLVASSVHAGEPPSYGGSSAAYSSAMTKAEVTLPAAVSSVPTARHFSESILSGWGLSELAWTATLIVSELSANAALHARGDAFTIQIWTIDGGIRIEVGDGSLRLPQQRSYSSDATTGRGLRLVAELATAWGVSRTADGKTVWAELQSAQRSGRGRDEEDVSALLDAFVDDADIIPISGLPGQPSAVAVERRRVAA